MNYVCLHSKTLYRGGQRQKPFLGLQPGFFLLGIFPPPHPLDPKVHDEPLNLDGDVSFHERLDELERPGLKIEIDCSCLLRRIAHIELVLPVKHSAAWLIPVALSPPPLDVSLIHPVEHHIGPSQVHKTIIIALPVDMVAKGHAFAVIWSKGLQNHPMNKIHSRPTSFLFAIDKQVAVRILVTLHKVITASTSHPPLV